MNANSTSSRSSGPVPVKARISREMKQQFAALANRRGVSEAKLIRLLIARSLGESIPAVAGELEKNSEQSRKAKPALKVRLNAKERRALRKRARARNVRVSRYITALVRAHLNADAPLLASESALLKKLVSELNAVGADLNHLVKASNEGVIWAEALKEVLGETLELFAKLGGKLSDFAKANRESWNEDATDQHL